jgi:aldehyde dehydrogenase (NAD+)
MESSLILMAERSWTLSVRLTVRSSDADEEDARRAIAAAKRALPAFSMTTKEERSAILRRLHEAVAARKDELTAIMVEEYGGTYNFSKMIVEMSAHAFLSAEKGLQETPLTESWGRTTVSYLPVGVAGLITAWNSNSLFICLKFASAVAAGCTVVIKPSELSALQTDVLLGCLHEARLPKGLLNIVVGRGETVGAELVKNPDVAKISFTGSVAVGQRIMRDGAETGSKRFLNHEPSSNEFLSSGMNNHVCLYRFH